MDPSAPLFKLPNYRGALRPAPWSYITLTSDLEHSLKYNSHPKCPHCAGKGYLKDGARPYLCMCTIRGLNQTGPSMP